MVLRDKLSPGTNPGFLKTEKMFRFKLLYIHKSVSENVHVNNIIIMEDIIPYIDMYYFMADGIAIWEILFKYQYLLFFRLMLLPFD